MTVTDRTTRHTIFCTAETTSLCSAIFCAARAHDRPRTTTSRTRKQQHERQQQTNDLHPHYGIWLKPCRNCTAARERHDVWLGPAGLWSAGLWRPADPILGFCFLFPLKYHFCASRRVARDYGPAASRRMPLAVVVLPSLLSSFGTRHAACAAGWDRGGLVVDRARDV